MKTKTSYSFHPLVLLLLCVGSVWAQRGPQDNWYLDREIDLPYMPGINNPRAIHIAHNGDIYVCNIGNDADRISVWRADGSFKTGISSYGSGDKNIRNPLGIDFGNNELFVADTDYHRIKVFNENGNFVRKFGTYGSGDGQMNQPRGIYFDSNGLTGQELYVSDSRNHRIQVFDLTGNFIRKFGTYGNGDGQLDDPSDVGIGPDGLVYVCSKDDQRVLVFQKDGSYVRKFNTQSYPQNITFLGSKIAITTWSGHKVKIYDLNGTEITSIGSGSPSTAQGEFNNNYGIAVDSNGDLYVGDVSNNRIQVFDSNLTFKKSVGLHGKGGMASQCIILTPENTFLISDGFGDRVFEIDGNGSLLRVLGNEGTADGEFDFPRKLSLGPSGKIYVSDTNNHRIQVFDRNGSFVKKFGTNGSANGQFNAPTGIAVSAEQEVFVVDRNNDRIQVFDSNGTFLRKWGSRGNLDGQLNDPVDLILDDMGNVVVSDYQNNRIVVFDKFGQFLRKWNVHSSAWNLSNLFGGLIALISDSNNYPYINLYEMDGTLVKSWKAQNQGWNSPVVGMDDGTIILANQLRDNGGVDKLEFYRQTFRTIRPDSSSEIPLPETLNVSQRSGTNYLDVTYRVNDADSATVQTALLGFVDGGNDLSKVIVPKTFVGNTVGKLGQNVPTGQSHTVTWNAGADWSVGFGELEMAVLAKDDRDLLNLHFLTLPPTDSNSTELKINRSPITNNDLLNVWYWLLATDSSYHKVGSGIFATSDLNTTGIQPNQVSGLMLWLDAKDIDADGAEDSPSVDDLMTEWKDKSSSALSFVSASGKEPKYIAANSKSKAGWYFNNGYVKSTDAWSGLKEIAAVMNLMDNRFWAAGIIGRSYQRYLAMNGSNRVYEGGADRIMGIAGYSEPIPLSVNHVVFKTFPSPKSSNQMHIGSNGDNYENWNGTISEVIGFDRILTDEERNGLHAYFHSKWGTNLANPIASGSYFSDQSKNIILNRMNLREATFDEVTRAKEGSTKGMINQFTPSFQVGPNERPDKVNEYGFDTGSTSGIWVVPTQ